MSDSSPGTPAQALDPWTAEHIVELTRQVAQLTVLMQALNERVVAQGKQIDDHASSINGFLKLVDRVTGLEKADENERNDIAEQKRQRTQERRFVFSETAKGALAVIGGGVVAKLPDLWHWLFTFHH